MSSGNRRSSFSSSTTSSLAKSNAAVSRKRAPLGNITNQHNAGYVGSKSNIASSALVPSITKVAKTRKESSAGASNWTAAENSLPQPVNLKSSPVPSAASQPRKDETVSRVSAIPASRNADVFPSKSDGNSVSMDESMSTCDSFSSPEIEYMDNNNVPAIDTINRKTFSSLSISDYPEAAGSVCTREKLVTTGNYDKIADIDDNYADPQLCASYACDIYKHLRASEAKKRPSTDFMEKVQKDITANMRAILVDWLVEVAEEYRLIPDTLYLTVNYLDRYLSGNVMNRQKLQLLGVSCMMIASKYEEICAPQVEEYCYITDNTYFKEEVLDMESAVLNHLKFEMTAPTVKCFLRRFARAAQGIYEAPSTQLECMINYVAELSLLEYSMLRHAPSLVAAAAIFLAKYIICPSKRPWNSTLQHYTLYRPSDLRDCVADLHGLCSNSSNSNLPAIREKYSQHKYKCVAQKFCPPTIPSDYFNN